MEFMPGATAVGIVYNDGVVLAAEKRLAYRGFITTKKTKKIFKISKGVGAACAGLVADMQELIREVTSIIRLKELREGTPTPVHSVAKLTSILLFQNRLYPYITQIMIGGYVGKPEIYSLDPLGSLIKDTYIALGSGTEVAMGVLESQYREGMGEEEAKKLVVDSIKAAVGRDAASGDGVDMLVIDRDGTREYSYSF